MLSLNFPSKNKFVFMEDDCWGLQAVAGNVANGFTENPELYCFGIQGYDLDSILEIPTSVAVGNELEELYKPFYPAVFHIDDLSQQAVAASSISIPNSQLKEPEKAELEEKRPRSDLSFDAKPATTASAPKYKRRKSNCKRLVQQVAAEGLSEDKWAWRKYGQKPIKDSPYPRSYYRCSTSKECQARKQVEQSGTQPVKFIISYVGEHNHSQPTRRNSLAGTTRKRFSNPKITRPVDRSNESSITSSSSTISTSAVVYPTSPDLMGTCEEEISNENGVQEMITEVRDCNEVTHLMFYDDIFDSLNDLDGMVSDLPFDSNFYQQFSDDFI